MQSLRRYLAVFSLPEGLFVAGLYVLLLAFFAVMRLLLLWRNAGPASEVSPRLLAESFLVGFRFDLATSSYLLIPLFLLLVIFQGRARRWVMAGLGALVGVLVFFSLAEIEFYRELETRFNTLVLEYLDHPRIVAGIIWNGYPIFPYLLAGSALLALFLWCMRRMGTWWLKPVSGKRGVTGFAARTVTTALVLTPMIFTARGGFSSEPLRWGDSFLSEAPFANNLALNGTYALARSLLEKYTGNQNQWTRRLPEQEALDGTRKLLFLQGETDLSTPDYPLLRRETSGRAAGLSQGHKPVNVVVILMESFAARQVGALGAPTHLTPGFDRLCRDGILFDRVFSNGTHTHQGVFASLASFPNLPGYEYLMKTMEGNQEFSGLPRLLEKRGYQTLFLYNGIFSWDNKEGFFRQQGINRFIGTRDYVNPTFVDPVWGVSDHDVFMRANQEFREASRKGHFFGAILTLSNHSPFDLPSPLPFERIETGDPLDPRFNAMRYADWALEEFFREASKESYFDNTLFVLTADHGFGAPPAISELQLERFHVPLLFYAPKLLGARGEHRAIVASQVDIGPSVLALLGLTDAHQAWGRNLFATDPVDEGFAVIKPSVGKEVALVQGQHMLVVLPDKEPALYRYSLAFPPVANLIPPTEERERRALMEKQLRAYVETGLLALRARRLGVPLQKDNAVVSAPKGT